MSGNRRGAILLSILTMVLLVSCQSEADLAVCETADDLNDYFLSGDLDGYVAETEVLADRVDEADDQVLRDVGNSLRIVAFQWSESGFDDEVLQQANQTGVDVLNARCAELRG